MLDDPTSAHYDDLDEAIAPSAGVHPTWPYGDVVAKAEGLTQFDEAAVRAVLTRERRLGRRPRRRSPTRPRGTCRLA